MKYLSFAIVGGYLWILISGCINTSRPASDPPDPPSTAPATQPSSIHWRLGDAVIYKAQYTDGGGSFRTRVRIQGRNFNTIAASEENCQESADGQNWSRCALLLHTSDTEYDVIVNHSSRWPKVYVKVLGDDDMYSLPAIVAK